MIVNFNAEPALNQLLDRSEFDAFLSHASGIAHQLLVHPGFYGRALFIPQLDALMQRASQSFLPAETARTDPGLLVHVVTEVYETGGHTRVLEDMVRALPEFRHRLIVTDAMENYRSGRLSLGFLKERFEAMGLEVLYLGEPTLAGKTTELAAHIAQLAPQAVLLLAHHFDPIANAGVSGRSAPRVLYLHHCDFNPALGAARNDFIHVDLTPGAYQACTAQHESPPVFLGLSVEDRGVVDFSSRNSLVGVTCGASYKYAGRNEFSYGEVVAALFASGIEHILHIGDMPQEQMNQIHGEIHAAGQQAGRLIFQSNTPSLTRSLQEMAPGFFLCSYPLGGGKATLEAMSVGLPLLIPRSPSTPPLICTDVALGAGLMIEKLEDVPGVVGRFLADEADLGHRHREIFEQYYSPEIFRRKLLGLIASPAKNAAEE